MVQKMILLEINFISNQIYISYIFIFGLNFLDGKCAGG